MAIYDVKTAAELTTALGRTVGGDTIRLASGNYGLVNLANRVYASTVTITSASATAPAHFDGLTVSGSKNLAFSALDLGRGLGATEPEYTKLNTVQMSENVSFSNVSIHGSLDGDVTNDGIGLYVTDSKNVAVTGATFTENFRGLLVQRADGFTIGESRFDKIRSDGANFAASDRVTVRANTFTDFNRYGTDHADAIQFWNTGQTKGATDILIQNNVFIQTAAGKGAQGIFMYDLTDYKFTNVVIENNLMYGNDDWNGIVVNNGQNVRIANNTVLSSLLDPKQFWISVEKSDSVIVEKNVTDNFQISADVTNLSFADNISLAATPLFRSQFTNLETPSAPSDLMVSDWGFQGLSAILPAPAPAPAPTGPTLIQGTAGSDTLQGTTFSDKMIGVAATEMDLGKGTADKMWGKSGTDIFVLGDQRGTFYNDGANRSAGKSDYAQIMDFGTGDKIQLHGSLDQYLFVNGQVNKQAGVQIFLDTNGNHLFDSRDELIGHVVGVQSLGPDSFTFG
ncbi:hypothetical protein HJG53_11970 [Sphingomonas sp. ID1715]|uniref:right-handed parallel beta-helix repeat-containing protein n=1 Tax=Sphingomonas sp. ID1715 TaxID=1656898 RepID=UPI001488E3E0|nr:right-handed parallel beta-helix repeat-containing protein [Sphingomonas sp. ID1715]NNM77627.1 hypothetical protein [Sphingomonas sp. ID1715]